MNANPLNQVLLENSAKRELEISTQRARGVAWLVFLSYHMTLGLAYLLDLSPEARSFYFWVYGVGSLPSLIIAIALHLSQSTVWRALLPAFAVAPVLVETAYFYPLMGSSIWWACFVVGYASMIYFRMDEKWVAVGLIILTGAAGLVIAIFHSKLSQLPGNAVSHGYIRYALIQGSMVFAAILGVLLNNQLRHMVRNREMQLHQAISVQNEALEQLTQQRTEAERRRHEVESALAEISRLREEERQRAEREAFLMRYEQLMRMGYELSCQDFAQKLLDALSEDLNALGGLWYEQNGEIWRVTAAFGFPQKVGTEVKGGILRTTQLLRKPYMLTPVPEGIRMPRTALIEAKPVAVLYLPFYSTVTDEVVAAAELLIHRLPNSQMVNLIEGILPRIGTYWWGRQNMSSSTN